MFARYARELLAKKEAAEISRNCEWNETHENQRVEPTEGGHARENLLPFSNSIILFEETL